MAWTQTDIAALEAAIGLGARRVKFQTHEVEYQTTDDMLKALDRMKAEVDASARPGILFTEYHGGH